MDNWKIRQTVDLARGGQTLRVWPDALMVEGDNEAHTWEITVMEDGQPATLDGVTCLVHFLRERNGQDEDVICKGSVAGNVASVKLKKECYIEGPAIGIFRIVVDEKTLTLSKLLFTISKGPTGVVIDPGSVVGDLESLLAQMDRMESGTAAANKAAAVANTAAQTANTAAANADSKASAANTAAQTANTAAANADSKASAANTAAQTANTAADRVDTAIGNANTAANNANAAADRVDTAIGNANTAANNANAAAGNANSKAADAEAAALRLSAVELNVSMLPPSENPTASATQTDRKTIFSLGIPTSNLAYATFEVGDDMELMMHSPEGFDDIQFNLNENGELEVEIK